MMIWIPKLSKWKGDKIMAEIVTKDNIDLKRKVVRGPDWKWANQDQKGEGVMVDAYFDKYAYTWIRVKWDHEYHSRHHYRIGPDAFDLVYVDVDILDLVDSLDDKIEQMERRKDNGV